MKITWLGHSCFKVELNDYITIFDPTEDGYVPGLKPIKEEADLLILSHEHGDHNARSKVTLKGGLRDALPSIEAEAPHVMFGEKDCPYIITTIESYHDDQEGKLRGTNKITVLDSGDVRIAHFGDIGCMPEPEQLEELMDLDVALIPVGGFYTVSGEFASDIIRAISPKVVIPMHFRDDEMDFGFDVISTVDDFVRAMGQAEFKEKSSFEFDPANEESSEGIRVIVLEPSLV